MICSKVINRSLFFNDELLNLCTSLTRRSRMVSNYGTKCRAQSTSSKVVFISQSSDIFSNLAFEGWLYKNWIFDKRQVLFLYSNGPSVVIGRHQNPFVEANLPYLESAEVPFARRQSGGGAVYHDFGNLNCSFFTSRSSYNRKRNLAFICSALRETFNLDAQVNSRDDILLKGVFKVSGSAAKLGQNNAYHHCTLLINSDCTQLRLALKGDKTIDTNATASVPGVVRNVKEEDVNISVEAVQRCLANAFLQPSHEVELNTAHGITFIRPEDDWFPGLGEIRNELSSWQWLFGRTPRFVKTFLLPLPEHLIKDRASAKVYLLVHCQHGLIEAVTVDEKLGKQSDYVSSSALKKIQRKVAADLEAALKGTRYTAHLAHVISALISHPRSGGIFSSALP